MSDGRLTIPNDTALPNSEINAPYVFIGNEVYPLLKNLLKPYSGQQLNAHKEYNFNARLSRARRTVECAFGIIFSKWRILSKAIETSVTVADDIVKAICVLHNAIIDKEGTEHHLRNLSFARELSVRHDFDRPTQLAQNLLSLQ
uniref:uncharacterized protein LOC117611115 isoform X2 n=1 Tax=Osmia lignaria TaxID=473952 RepID=UPI0014788878|nr:uncharacterized protein LOC117611115 isoform X2 [Osmia lignaria]